MRQKVSLFWFRRDLRLKDNHGLLKALEGDHPVLPVFIFDTEIIQELPSDDPRINFIYDSLKEISDFLKSHSSSLCIKRGVPTDIWKELIDEFDVQSVYTNEDYEPYAIDRDKNIETLLTTAKIPFHSFKDQVLFAKHDVLKNDGTPYTVYTPYKNKWLEHLSIEGIPTYQSEENFNYAKIDLAFPELSDLGFKRSAILVKSFKVDDLADYAEVRNFPAKDKTSYLSPHLRFGTVSVRDILRQVQNNAVFTSELVWREFFMQILFHFPYVVHGNFRKKYDGIRWINDQQQFEKWKQGQTGYPIVDAGMRELNATGYMHNRVRMVVASFLCKHLLIDWRWGEAYFAEKLLDFELSSNNGNWQWAAGTGCDAAPYFRVFNPTEQVKKFDSQLAYIRKWVPELDSFDYPTPIVEHKSARLRAIEEYKKGIERSEAN